jgi:hypothetical protein
MAAGVMNQDIVDAKFTDDNPESCDLRCLSCINLKMELFRVTTELISMTEIVRILEEQMEVKHRMDCVHSMDMSRQGSLKFNNWSQVPKHNLLGDKTVVNSLQKSAISTYNRSETLHIQQRSMGNTTSEMEKRPHRTPKVSHKDNMPNGVATLRNKKLKG